MSIPPFELFPRVVRQAAFFAIGWRNRNRRFAGEFRQWERLLQESLNWNSDQQNQWQHERLIALIDSARSGTRYYAERLSDPVAPGAGQTLRQLLDTIPILEKQTLRMRPEGFRNKRIAEAGVTTTSGSTGSPMSVGHDKLSIQRRFAFLMEHLRLAGVENSLPSVRLSGRIICSVGERHRKPWLYNFAENQLFLSTYHLDEVHGPAIAEKLHRFQPVLLDGYPSGILETLRLLRRHHCKLDSLKAIITTSETLYPDMRQELSDLSGGAPVMDYYAASEGVPFIQQCPHGTYHVRWQSGIFEVDNDSTISFEGDGELICTSFVQDRTPLIRYKTGDTVQGLNSKNLYRCDCGLVTPTVERVLGRIEDMIYTPDGRALGMFTYRTLKSIDGLGDTQVIQHGYSTFEVNSILVDNHLNTELLADDIKKNFERALGYPITLQFNQVTQLPRGARGKVRLVISNVTRQ